MTLCYSYDMNDQNKLPIQFAILILLSIINTLVASIVTAFMWLGISDVANIEFTDLVSVAGPNILISILIILFSFSAQRKGKPGKFKISIILSTIVIAMIILTSVSLIISSNN